MTQWHLEVVELNVNLFYLKKVINIKGIQIDCLLQWIIKKRPLTRGTSLSVQWLGLHTSSAGDVGSIPDWGTKISYATQCHPPKKNEVCRVRNLGYTWKMQGSIILCSSSMMKASFALWSVTHTKGYLATFIHLLVKLLLLFNVYWVFIMCKVSISPTFSFYNPSCPSSPLHQSPSLQFISFLASQQILKSGRQGILKVGSGCGGNRHIPFLELRRHRCHHWAAVWSRSSLSHRSPAGPFMHPSQGVPPLRVKTQGGVLPRPYTWQSACAVELHPPAVEGWTIYLPLKVFQAEEDLIKQKGN